MNYSSKVNLSKNPSFVERLKFVTPIYIENLAFFCMPFLDLAFLDIHSREIILIYGMMLPWFFITEISINSIIILVSGEEISRRVESGEFFKRRIRLATMIVILITGIMTIVAAAVTTNIIAASQFWSIFPYFAVFAIGLMVYAQRKMVAIELTSLGNPRVALTGSILGVAVNLGLNYLALQVFDPASTSYLLAIASSTVIAYLFSGIYVRYRISNYDISYADNLGKPFNVLLTILRPLRTLFISSLELISSQLYTLLIIALLITVNADFLYVRSFLVQFFLIVTATGIAVSIYCNNIISERIAEGEMAVYDEVQKNIKDILRVSFAQSLFVIAVIYTFFQLGIFGSELSDAGTKSLVIGTVIYMMYEPVKATNIMLLTVIRRLNVAPLPSVISVASNFVALCFSFLVTRMLNSEILIFTLLITIVFTEELFRCKIYYWFLKSRLNKGLVYV